MDDLGFEQADDCLGPCVVTAVTNASDRGFDACLDKPFGEFDRQMLAAAVAVLHQPHALYRTGIVDRLFKASSTNPA